jgi:hypothetical protein
MRVIHRFCDLGNMEYSVITTILSSGEDLRAILSTSSLVDVFSVIALLKVVILAGMCCSMQSLRSPRCCEQESALEQGGCHCEVNGALVTAGKSPLGFLNPWCMLVGIKRLQISRMGVVLAAGRRDSHL